MLKPTNRYFISPSCYKLAVFFHPLFSFICVAPACHFGKAHPGFWISLCCEERGRLSRLLSTNCCFPKTILIFFPSILIKWLHWKKPFLKKRNCFKGTKAFWRCVLFIERELNNEIRTSRKTLQTTGRLQNTTTVRERQPACYHLSIVILRKQKMNTLILTFYRELARENRTSFSLLAASDKKLLIFRIHTKHKLKERVIQTRKGKTGSINSGAYLRWLLVA